MQTFLPYEDFARSAEVLDPPRLGKQRVEVLQVLRALEVPDYGWSNHPAVAMWRGRTPALVTYGLACVRAWRALGHADSTEPLISEFAPEAAGLDQHDLARAGMLPSWLGSEPVHLSHRSALVRKDPQRYRAVFGDVPDDLPYAWPGPDPQPEPLPVGADGSQGAAGAAEAPGLWVARAPDAAGLGTFVGEGVIGLDASSGVDVDALALRAHTGTEGAAAAPPAKGRKAAAPPVGAKPPGTRRRNGKAVRQLQALLEQVRTGDEVGVLVAGESSLLLGRVSGGYVFVAGPEGAVVHRRPVTWHGVVPRASLPRPYLLQDPRALFRVPARGPAPGSSATGPVAEVPAGEPAAAELAAAAR